MALAEETLNEALAGVSQKEIEMCKEVLQRVYDNLTPDLAPAFTTISKSR